MPINPLVRCILLIAWLTFSTISRADMIPMRDFIHLQRGMSEAEVLYRVGLFDYQHVQGDGYHHILRKTWVYLPAERNSRGWITEIVFNGRGVVQQLNRYRP